MDNFLTRLDQVVTGIFSEWDYVSTALLTASIGCLIYFTVSSRAPDTHPFFLLRQSRVSPTRKEGKSPVYRSHSTPHELPLCSGLNIGDSIESKWIRGKNGTVGDVWKRAVQGVPNREGILIGETGRLFTLHGSKGVTEHDLQTTTEQIREIGKYLDTNFRSCIAVYLPNSIEFLVALFACEAYDLDIALLKYDQPLSETINQLKSIKADTIIAAAGSFPIDAVRKDCHAVKYFIWVLDEGNEHMDWKEVSPELKESIVVTTWQDIIQKRATVPTIIPSGDERFGSKKIITFPRGKAVKFTHKNIIAAIGGQLSSIPPTQSFTSSDLFLPVDCLSDIYTLIMTLTALYSNSSVALTSVASHSPSLTLATRGIAPTVIAASSTTMLKLHEETKQKLSTPLYKFVHWLETRELVRNGVLPIASFVSRFYDQLRPVIGTTPGELRLLYISTSVASESAISSSVLSDLRIYTRSRIIYALTAPEVAGAVTQTGVYDYRVSECHGGVHFGAPVSSLELYFQDKGIYKSDDSTSCGEIIVAGPAVVDGEANLGVIGIMNDDLTLSLLK